MAFPRDFTITVTSVVAWDQRVCRDQTPHAECPREMSMNDQMQSLTPAGCRSSCRRILARTVASCCLLGLLAVDHAAAQSRVSRSASSYARQLRQRSIDAVRQEVAAAKQVLEQLQSQSGATQEQLRTAVAELDAARERAEAAQQSDREIHRRLHDIEARVLADQDAASAYARQKLAVDAARAEVHAAIHDVLKLPPHAGPVDQEAERLKDLSALTEAQRRQLQADPDYLAARDRLQAATRTLETTANQLFAVDKEWTAATAEHEQIEEQQAAARAAQRERAADMREARGKAQSAEELARRALATIADGEARLRQLGVAP